jgi:hypothetical protein
MNPKQRKEMTRTVQEAADFLFSQNPRLLAGIIADLEVLATVEGLAADEDGIAASAYPGWTVENFKELIELIKLG